MTLMRQTINIIKTKGFFMFKNYFHSIIIAIAFSIILPAICMNNTENYLEEENKIIELETDTNTSSLTPEDEYIIDLLDHIIKNRTQKKYFFKKCNTSLNDLFICAEICHNNKDLDTQDYLTSNIVNKLTQMKLKEIFTSLTDLKPNYSMLQYLRETYINLCETKLFICDPKKIYNQYNHDCMIEKKLPKNKMCNIKFKNNFINYEKKGSSLKKNLPYCSLEEKQLFNHKTTNSKKDTFDEFIVKKTKYIENDYEYIKITYEDKVILRISGVVIKENNDPKKSLYSLIVQPTDKSSKCAYIFDKKTGKLLLKKEIKDHMDIKIKIFNNFFTIKEKGSKNNICYHSVYMVYHDNAILIKKFSDQSHKKIIFTNNMATMITFNWNKKIMKLYPFINLANVENMPLIQLICLYKTLKKIKI